MRQKRSVTVVVAGLVSFLIVPLVKAAPAPPTKSVITLSPGASDFWTDAFPRATSAALPACAATEAPCNDFAVVLRGAGARLRVALDSPGNNTDVALLPGLSGVVAQAVTQMSIEIFDPAGKSLGTATGPYSMEAYAQNAQPGRYYVRTKGSAATGFRMRAKLEKQLPITPTGREKLLLPNLQLIPPFEFTFNSPVGSQVVGKDPLSCNPYEQEEYAARRCLRFSVGPQNVGAGPLMLAIQSDLVQGLVGRIPVTQLIKRGDGSLAERPGGYSTYHKTHAHYHHNGFGTLELLKVLDPAKGEMVAAGIGPKQGFCMEDFKIAVWNKFLNDPPKSVRQDCDVVGSPSQTTQLGLGAGWGDIYSYHLDGNYVEFGDNTDGLYVVRSIADAFQQVLESDHTDNAGYAYIRVVGNTIQVLERGRGMSPWDRGKVRVNDNLAPNAPA
jgi:hypothetical protein